MTTDIYITIKLVYEKHYHQRTDVYLYDCLVTDFSFRLIKAPLGMFCARKLLSRQQDGQIQERIMQLIKKDSLFAAGLGYYLRESFMELNDTIQDTILNEAKQNPSLYNALGL